MFARILIIFLCSCACINLHAQVSYITTIAGKAGVPASDSGEGGLAVNARFYGPYSICLDKSDNIYIVDGYNGKVKKIDAVTNIITTIAGKGVMCPIGDGGPATDALLLYPEDVKVDDSGNIYIADAINYRIRKIDRSTGIISTIAGNGVGGYSGDGGPATNAEINGPVGISLDKSGNIYIADWMNNRVRKVSSASGIITTIAGNGTSGFSGDGGLAVNAAFTGPIDVVPDSAGNVFIADQWNHRIRKIDAVTGILSTIAGNGTLGHYGDGGLAVNAMLNQPVGLTIDKQNNLFIAEFGNGIVRRIDAITGIITTVAGTGTWGYSGDGGPATDAQLSCTRVVFDSYGQMIIGDYGTNVIRKVVNPQLSVNNTTKTNNEISVFPNPANDELTVEYHFANTEYGVFEIIDLTGRIATTKTLRSAKQNETVDIHALTQGMYLYRVSQNNLLVSTGKIIKQ